MSWLKRREFLHRSLCAAAGSGLFGSLIPKLTLAAGAAPKVLNGTGYQALVCLYLYGGYDAFSVVVPRQDVGGTARADYDVSRRGTGTGPGGGQQNPSDLRIASNTLLNLPAYFNNINGSSWGLNPRMPGLASLLNAGKAALVANIGPLVRPINYSEWDSGSVAVPAQLFSHSDQTVLWQTPRADATTRTGWGGRLADIFAASNANPNLSMNMSLDGENVFQAGLSVSPYFLGDEGAERIEAIDVSNSDWNARRRSAFLALANRSNYPHPFERAYAERLRKTVTVSEDLALRLRADRSTVQQNGVAVENGYNDDTYRPFWDAFGLAWQRLDQGRPELPDLARQLLVIARVIRQRVPLQMSKQLFFAAAGGFDTHDDQNADLPDLLWEVSQSIKGFYDVIAALGLGDRITLFTSSEFGRTLTNNGDGTDHGWGSHHFVVGDSVIGDKIYGRMPSLSLAEGAGSANPLNVGDGRLIPTLAVDQYGATLASWFGLSDSDRSSIFPNLQFMSGTGGRLAVEGPNLGFLRPVV
jgi:uncharacterized protein (DUF1501 family)